MDRFIEIVARVSNPPQPQSEMAIRIWEDPRIQLSRQTAMVVSLAARDDIGTTLLPLATRLGDFGASSIPPLLELLDRAGLLPDGSRFQAGSNWARTYEAAINGLCRAAFSDDSTLDIAEIRLELINRLQSGEILDHADDQTSTLGMLLAFGVNQETLWPIFRTEDTEQAREQFLRRINMAKNQPGCPTTQWQNITLTTTRQIIGQRIGKATLTRNKTAFDRLPG